MKKIIIPVIVLSLFLSGCGEALSKKNSTVEVLDDTVIVDEDNKISEGTIKEIRFKDMVEVNELRKLDGKLVKIVGFFAQSSPLDGSMVYLMNMPYQNCVYCLPNTNQLMNTMAIYPKGNKSIEFTDLPVEVTGKIKFEDFTDEMGYSYGYRIVDAEIKEANVEELNESVKIYTDLVNAGFTDKIGEVIVLVNNINKIQEESKNYEEVKIIPKEKINDIYNLFNNLDKNKYKDVLAIVEELEVLVQEINNSLISKDYKNMNKFVGKEFDIYYNVYEWLMQPEL